MKQQKKIRKKRIFIPLNKRKAIQAETSAAYTTVFQSLNYTMDSELAKQIRRLAYEYGGKVVTKVIRPMTEDDIYY